MNRYVIKCTAEVPAGDDWLSQRLKAKLRKALDEIPEAGLKVGEITFKDVHYSPESGEPEVKTYTRTDLLRKDVILGVRHRKKIHGFCGLIDIHTPYYCGRQKAGVIDISILVNMSRARTYKVDAWIINLARKAVVKAGWIITEPVVH